MEYKLFEPTESEHEAILEVYLAFQSMQKIRDKSYYYFNGSRNLIEFIDDSAKRFNGYIPPRDDLTMDWQARCFVNITRDLTISFLSKVALTRPRAKFKATDTNGYQDTMRAHILEKLYDYSQAKELGDSKFFFSALEATTKGTVIAYEGYRKIKRKVQEMSKYDPTTGKFTAEEKTIVDYDDCYKEIVPLEDFYISDIFQPDIQLQDKVIWRSVMKKSAAQTEFSKFKNWDSVKPGSYATNQEQSPFFKNQNYNDLDADQVEILRYYQKSKDKHVILANGIPIYIGAFPFRHKRLPFARGIFEPFSTDFFYGNSLPNKIATQQDVLNTLWNMGLDQTWLNISKPIFTSDPDADEAQDIVIQPGRINKVTDINAWKTFDFGALDSSFFNMLNLSQKFTSDNAGNPSGGGGAQTQRGGKVTARQAMLKEEEARQVLGLSAKMLENYDCECANLRVKNILQFYPLSKIEDLGGDPMEYKKLFSRVIRLPDTELTDGTYGTTVVKIAKNKQALPTEQDITTEEEMGKLQGSNVEIFAVTPDYIRNVDVDVQIVPRSSFQQNKSIEQALGIEFYQMMQSNQLVNQLENTRDAIKLYDKDPDRFLKQEVPNPEASGAQQPQGAQLPQVTAQVAGQGQRKGLKQLAGV